AHALYPPTASGECSPELQAVYKAWKAVGVDCPLPAGVLCALCTDDIFEPALQIACYDDQTVHGFTLCGNPPYHILAALYFPNGETGYQIIAPNITTSYFEKVWYNNPGGNVPTYQDYTIDYTITDASGNTATLHAHNCCQVRATVNAACAYVGLTNTYLVTINVNYEYDAPDLPNFPYTLQADYLQPDGNGNPNAVSQTITDTDGNLQSSFVLNNVMPQTTVQFTLTDWRGCQLTGLVENVSANGCTTLVESIIVGIPNYNSPPALNLTSGVPAGCVNEPLCITYQAEDPNGDAAHVTLANLPDNLSYTQTITQSGSVATGVICFTLSHEVINTTLNLTLLAFDYQNYNALPIQMQVLCCPT
ncbi:MAG TPA: hypothetical protein PK239_19265, partial [Chitinophagales bacterium]|nr:hypothetical protein [Chitinophagales bacterium]